MGKKNTKKNIKKKHKNKKTSRLKLKNKRIQSGGIGPLVNPLTSYSSGVIGQNTNTPFQWQVPQNLLWHAPMFPYSEVGNNNHGQLGSVQDNLGNGQEDIRNGQEDIRNDQDDLRTFSGDLTSLPGTHTFTDFAVLNSYADLGTADLSLITKVALDRALGLSNTKTTLEEYRKLYGKSTPQFMKTFQIVFEKLKTSLNKGRTQSNAVEITTQQLIDLFLVFKDGDGRFLVPKEYEVTIDNLNVNLNYQMYMSLDLDPINLPDAYAFLFFYDIEVMIHYNFENALVKALQNKEYRQEYEMDDDLVKLLVLLEYKGTIPSALDLVYDVYLAKPDWTNPVDWFKSNTRSTRGHFSRFPTPYFPSFDILEDKLQSSDVETLTNLNTKVNEEIEQEPYIWFKRQNTNARGAQKQRGDPIFLYKYENRKNSGNSGNSGKSKESETPGTHKEKQEIIEDILKVVAGVVTAGLLFSLSKYSYLQYKIKKCKQNSEMFEEKDAPKSGEAIEKILPNSSEVKEDD